MNKKNFVCLIQPHTSFKLMNVQPALFDQFDSIGLMSLSAYLKEKGYEVEILHLAKRLETDIVCSKSLIRLNQESLFYLELEICGYIKVWVC